MNRTFAPVPAQGQLLGKRGWLTWPLLIIGVLGLLSSLYFFYRAYQQSGNDAAVQQTLLQQHRLSGNIRKRWTQGQGLDQLEKPLEVFLQSHSELIDRANAADGDNDALNAVSERTVDALAGLRNALPAETGEPPAVVDAEATRSITRASNSTGVFGKATTLIETTATLRAMLARDQATPVQVETAGHLYQLSVSVADRLGVNTGDPNSPDIGAAQGPWLVFEQILKRMEAMVGTGEVSSENHLVLINDVRARQMEMNRLFGAIRRGEVVEQAPVESVTQQNDDDSTRGVLTRLDTRHAQLDDGLVAFQSTWITQQSARANWFNWGLLTGLLSSALLTMLSLYALTRTQVDTRVSRSDEQQREASILKLLNEIESLAEGDLNTQATVTEGVTGAIADSVNYAVSELRRLVGTVSTSSERVSVAVEETGATAQQLANAAVVQSREISRSSAYMTALSDTMSQLSVQSTEAAEIAGESVALATEGAVAVQQTAETVHVVNDNTRQATRMMRRLVDSASQITRSVRLIDEAAEKTRLLAMNTTIRSRAGNATAATEARQDLADVADQVQTLANRLGQSAAEIETLVTVVQQDVGVALDNIQQIDTSMVDLTGRAGNAENNLTQINDISERLQQVVDSISTRARKQTAVVEKLAGNMDVINEVTRQSSHGLRLSASALEDLRLMSVELRDSVAEFSLPERDIAAIAARTDRIRSHEHVGAGSATLAVNHDMLALGDNTLDRQTRAIEKHEVDDLLNATLSSTSSASSANRVENRSADLSQSADSTLSPAQNDATLLLDTDAKSASGAVADSPDNEAATDQTQLNDLTAGTDDFTLASDDVLVDMDSDATQLLDSVRDSTSLQNATQVTGDNASAETDSTLLIDSGFTDKVSGSDVGDSDDADKTQVVDPLFAGTVAIEDNLVEDIADELVDIDSDATLIIESDTDTSVVKAVTKEKLDIGHD